MGYRNRVDVVNIPSAETITGQKTFDEAIITEGAIDWQAPLTENLNIRMGDAAGVNFVNFEDSAGLVVASINSDGVSTFSGGSFLADDVYQGFGNVLATPDAAIGWNTTQTVDGWYFGTSAAQNTVIIAEYADRTFDFAHGAQTNPTLFIHSAVQSTTQWVSLTHNQTDGLIDTGVGILLINAPEGVALRDSSRTALYAVNDGSTATWSTSGGDNIIIAPTTSGNLTLNSAGADFGVLLQNRTITAGAANEAVTISPTWATENFLHIAQSIVATQNGANTNALEGQRISLVKATGATTLDTMNYTRYLTPTLAGTVTNVNGLLIEDLSLAGGTASYGINIASQTANATTTRAMLIQGTGANNAIQFGNSPLIYSSGAEVIRFDDSTAARGISFTLTAAGNQTIAATAGTLVLTAPDIGAATFTTLTGSNAGNVLTLSNTSDAASVQVGILQGNRATPTDADEAYLSLQLSDSAGNQDEQARITWAATTVADGATQDGDLIFSTLFNGALTEFLRIDGSTPSIIMSGNSDTATFTLDGSQFIINASDGPIVLRDANVTAIQIASDGTTATWSTAGSDNIVINTVTAGNLTLNASGTTSQVILQNRTITPGAAYQAVSVPVTFAAENFAHEGLRLTVTQNGANSSTLTGLGVAMVKATGATTLDTMTGINIAAAGVTGTVTNAYGIDIADQSTAGGTTSYGLRIQSQTANATTTRAIEVVGTGISNAIRLGASPNIYSSGAEVINFSDSTDARNISFTLTAAGNQTIAASAGILILNAATTINLASNSVTALSATSDGTTATWQASSGDHITISPAGSGNLNLTSNGGDFSIFLQNRTITAGAANEAVQITPTWATENFQHTALHISATQNGANSNNLVGLNVALTKATAATTLNTMNHIVIAAPTLTGTVTNVNGMLINDLSLAGGTVSSAINIASQSPNATTTRAIVVVGTGSENSIQLGNSPLLFSSGAEVIRMADSTASRSIIFTLTAASTQTIGTSAGNLVLSPTSANVATAANVDVDMSAGGRLFGGGVQINSQTLAANTNLAMDENDGHIDITTGAASDNTITLPAASGNQGMIVSFYLEVDGGFNAVITRAGADVIQNGAADLANTTVTLDTAGEYLMLQCVSASMWQVLVNSGGVVA